jgi:hypothetical protein
VIGSMRLVRLDVGGKHVEIGFHRRRRSAAASDRSAARGAHAAGRQRQRNLVQRSAALIRPAIEDDRFTPRPAP